MFYALYILNKMARKETRRPQNPHKNGRTYNRENWPEKYEKGGMSRSRGHEKIVCNYSGISNPKDQGYISQLEVPFAPLHGTYVLCCEFSQHVCCASVCVSYRLTRSTRKVCALICYGAGKANNVLILFAFRYSKHVPLLSACPFRSREGRDA